MEPISGTTVACVLWHLLKNNYNWSASQRIYKRQKIIIEIKAAVKTKPITSMWLAGNYIVPENACNICVRIEHEWTHLSLSDKLSNIWKLQAIDYEFVYFDILAGMHISFTASTIKGWVCRATFSLMRTSLSVALISGSELWYQAVLPMDKYPVEVSSRGLHYELWWWYILRRQMASGTKTRRRSVITYSRLVREGREWLPPIDCDSRVEGSPTCVVCAKSPFFVVRSLIAITAWCEELF